MHQKEEFLKLLQGETTVVEYHRKFLELSRYAEKDVATDARKQEKFREGLQPDIELALAIINCADFATLVSNAFQAETALTNIKNHSSVLEMLAHLRFVCSET